MLKITKSTYVAELGVDGQKRLEKVLKGLIGTDGLKDAMNSRIGDLEELISLKDILKIIG